MYVCIKATTVSEGGSGQDDRDEEMRQTQPRASVSFKQLSESEYVPRINVNVNVNVISQNASVNPIRDTVSPNSRKTT